LKLSLIVMIKIQNIASLKSSPESHTKLPSEILGGQFGVTRFGVNFWRTYESHDNCRIFTWNRNFLFDKVLYFKLYRIDILKLLSIRNVLLKKKLMTKPKNFCTLFSYHVKTIIMKRGMIHHSALLLFFVPQARWSRLKATKAFISPYRNGYTGHHASSTENSTTLFLSIFVS